MTAKSFSMTSFNLKSLFAAGALAVALGLGLPASEARADVSVGIGVGVYPPAAGIGWGGGYYDGGYGGGYGYGGGPGLAAVRRSGWLCVVAIAPTGAR